MLPMIGLNPKPADPPGAEARTSGHSRATRQQGAGMDKLKNPEDGAN